MLLETDEADSAGEPHIAMNDDGAAVVAWMQFDGVSDQIWATLYTRDAGWSAADPISHEVNSLSGPLRHR